FTDVEEWVVSEDREWPYSFVNICQALGIEPHYLRTGLRRWREREQARGLSATNVVRFPFRRVNGRRQSITGRAVGLRRSAYARPPERAPSGPKLWPVPLRSPIRLRYLRRSPASMRRDHLTRTTSPADRRLDGPD